MLRNPYPVRALSHDVRHLVGVEIGQYTQQNHLGMLRRQVRNNQIGCPLTGQLPQRGVLGLIRRNNLLKAGWVVRVGVPSHPLAPMIGNAAPRNGEHPGPKRGLVPGEARQAFGYSHPDLTDQVVGPKRLLRPHEPHQTWV